MTKVILDTIFSHLLPLLEEEFIKLEPTLQADLMKEAQVLSVKLESWIASKVKA